jgi:D-alanyl-D-alanine carboxypeptidase/D-alanyl-D-alanine-endopeptidase (penicillin-binding protein 4)
VACRPLRAPFLASLALAIGIVGCASSSGVLVASQASSRVDARTALSQDLAGIFGIEALAHAHWSILVSSLKSGETLFSLDSADLMVPASTQKVLTAAAAGERLGWDYRFSTRILATGPITASTLDGHLVIIGNGDPSINPRHPDRWRAFDDWAAAIRAKGIVHVSGDLIGDDDAFDEPGWGLGWSWDDLTLGYGAAIGALQYNENQVEVVVGPAMTAGARSILTTQPFGSGIFVENSVVTSPPGTETKIDVLRIAGTTFLDVRGQIALDAKPATILAAVENPTRMYLNAFNEALGRHGIDVAGHIIDVDQLPEPLTFDEAVDLVADQSPPLAEIIDVAMKWSRNGYAETLLYALSPPGEPASSEKGLAALRETLTALGVPSDSYQPRDGSGLSRYDLLSAESLVGTLIAIWMNPEHAPRFRGTLPEAGVSGTLANRMRATPAESRVWAKTGSMSNIRSISGYLMTRDDEPLVFAFLVNNFRVPSADVDAVFDRALVRLVEFRR